MKNYVLHLENSADVWENSTPVGNGSMGLSVFGRTDSELFVLNEETVWDEKSEMKPAGDFKDKLEHIRSLFLAGKNFEAAKWAEDNLESYFNFIASYEVAGKVNVDFDDKSKAKDYSRDLCLNSGIATVKYSKKGVETVEECFASYEEKLLVAKFGFSAPSSFTLSFERDFIKSYMAEDDTLVVRCSTANGTHYFGVGIRVVTDGSLKCDDGKFRVENATDAVIYISIVTDNIAENYLDACKEKLVNAPDYDEIKAAMNRVTKKLSDANIDDEQVLATVDTIFIAAASRATAIKDGTYDFSLDEQKEPEEEFELTEDYEETEEDKELDRKDAEKNRKLDVISTWICFALLIGAFAFLVYRFIDAFT